MDEYTGLTCINSRQKIKNIFFIIHIITKLLKFCNCTKPEIKYKVLKYHMGYKKVAKDCWQDLKADWYGIQKAKEHGYCSEKVKNVYKDVFNKK